jgi:hypothetical protein
MIQEAIIQASNCWLHIYKYNASKNVHYDLSFFP